MRTRPERNRDRSGLGRCFPAMSLKSGMARRDLLEILEDRHGCASTIVTSQLPVEHWHEAIGDPTLADAILDRLIHNAHRLKLTGESMRKAAADRKSVV